MATATPFLMFQGNAQVAMDLYVATFPDSRIVRADEI
jgi:predicted 3-demethylubiquinone-9 3-methyltransferase (glyoxalase superfamily)